MNISLPSVQAGFPSPTEHLDTSTLSLDEHFIAHPEATYFLKVEGNSMVGRGIFSDDILIVDKQKEAHTGDVVIACIDGAFCVKTYEKAGDAILLCSANNLYQPIRISSEVDFSVWGIVTYVIHKP